MHEQPTPQHAFLARLAGEWTSEFKADMGPDQPEHKSTGRERVRLLGGLWAVCEGESDGSGGEPHSSVMTLGYDATRDRYVGTFVASMMSYLWTYNGTLDESGNVLTLNATGPSFAEPGTVADYRDVIEFKGDSHRTMTSHVQMPDGTWNAFMVADYRRVG